MRQDELELDLAWIADAKPMRLPWGDLVSPLPSSSVFVVLSDLGFWVCGDAGLQRFGSPLYDSSCLQHAVSSRVKTWPKWPQLLYYHTTQ